jgi:hypothetical protein
MLIGAGFLLNKWQRWWVSADLLQAETARADAARADAAVTKADTKAEADARVASISAAMERRILELREDAALRVAQVRADSQAELDRLLKVVDAVQREVESWRQAFHIADAANGEEAEARWDRIEARWDRIVASMDVIKTFVVGVQRAGVVDIPPRELDGAR